uniref:GCN5-like N-acetyltransferase n=1 Tax=Goniotrichopsis reniformis TaxID=468933 RepID=UPI001FCDD580|nr:GCN5-like N-acetyltransferase [Goniotrichopsis reniformis]UNJ14712.1 GCN5-like N-acetyltransferase [Goniotrichopsis reniformis]
MLIWIKFFKQSVNTNFFLHPLELMSKTFLVTEKSQLFILLSNKVNMYELEQLCSLVGWGKRPPKKVKCAMNNSIINLTLYSDYNSKYKLIGFVRAISDQAFNATIWDMVIHPDYQSQGLGTLLMKKIIQELRYLEIDTITLFADSKSIKFYNKLGFITDPYNIKGMFWYPQ